ncbi:MAG: SDR family oxidoreductase, partial [Dehalococcoidia bacterium]|jgi:NAD(P)-dependent dehydrogenase (short-subunit alcohol dehydrogenase family)|nr:SDR family oxidoreductase [Dehalococcoidia bacterium]
LNAYKVKTLGYVRCSREVIDVMIRQGNGGRIVNIGGMVSRQVSYAGRKSVGVVAIPNASIPIITKNMSDLVAEHGITVNCIHPSHTRTPRQTRMIEKEAESRGISVDEVESSRAQNIPIGRRLNLRTSPAWPSSWPPTKPVPSQISP